MLGQGGDGKALAELVKHQPDVRELPGEYRVRLRIESLPAPSYAPWPTFEQPVEAE